MTAPACPDAGRLEAHALGATDESIAIHVASCPKCQGLVEEMRANDELLGKLRAFDDGPRSPAVRVPGYTILGEIHRGGQGVVLRAIQESTRRTVALKVLLGGALATSVQRRRFEREVELVAGLDHPGIVTVYERAETEDGALCFAMQLVEGVTLDAWAAARATDGGLEGSVAAALFEEICAAVSFAHQRGVIHRDLKPANILVSDDGAPHVVDFGLARPAPGTGQDRLITQTGSFLGTLAYASPEHVSGDPNAIDVRSDVYSLGAMLYERLAGHRPVPQDGDLGTILHAIRTTDPPRLRTDADLATIVHTALAKDPQRRYQSAAALGEDLRRWRRHEPIAARRDSAAYVIGRLLRRHRAAAVAAAVFALAVAAFLVVLLVQNHRVRTEAAKLRQVNLFLEDTLGSVSAPGGGGDVSVRDLLDEAVQWIDIALADEPEVAASIRVTVGGSYRNLGLYEEAGKQLQAALATRRALFEDDHPQVAQAMNALALLRHREGRLDEAADLFAGALARRRRSLGDETLEVSLTLANLALLELDRGRLDRSEALLAESMQIRRRLYGEQHADVAMCLFNLARVAERRGDLPLAAVRHRAALGTRRAVLDVNHPDLARSLEALGLVELRAGRADEAVTLLQECLQRRTAAHGEDHWLVAATRSDLGAALAASGRSRAAREQLERAEAALRAALGADDERTRRAAARRDAVRSAE